MKMIVDGVEVWVVYDVVSECGEFVEKMFDWYV